MLDRLGTFACTSSIGPGATNMVTGAALATIDRLPVLLLPGDVFASRRPDPVLQQLEVPTRGDVSVNDAFAPVSRYFDRITRPEQIVPADLAGLRVLPSQADTGAVTLALRQDVQTEAFDVPDEFLAERVWHIPRPIPDGAALSRLVELIGAARRPLIVAGGGVIYSRASEALRIFVDRTGIPVAETQAGKGALPWDHPVNLGAIGVTGTTAANAIAADADLVIGIGTRWSDFTTGSRALFARSDVRFANINVAEFDAPKLGALAVVGDARVVLEALAFVDHRVDNRGFASIGALSRSLGLDGFGTHFRYRTKGSLGLDSEGDPLTMLPVDLAANAESLGARVLRPKTTDELRSALVQAKHASETTVVYTRVSRDAGVEEGGAWWQVATPEVAETEPVRDAHEAEAPKRRRQRWHVGPP